jgi:hypothetical protein
MGAVLVGLENSVNLKDASVLRQSDLVVNQDRGKNLLFDGIWEVYDPSDSMQDKIC